MIIPALPVAQNHAMVNLFEKKFGHSPTGFAALPEAGSSRKYIRLFGEDTSAIGVWGHDKLENEAFLRWANFFSEKNIAVPEIYGEDLTADVYLQEDLGADCLLDIRKKEQSKSLGAQTKKFYQQAIDTLVNIQKIDAADIEANWFYPERDFNKEAMLRDLRYGQYYFFKALNFSFSASLLEKDFQKLATDISSHGNQVLMIRDFQARNLMIQNGKVSIIDFQGLRKGPALYDLISLLYQAKAKLSKEDRADLMNYYDEQNTSCSFTDEQQSGQWTRLKMIRFLQVLGAYGYRGLFEKKPHFISSIPKAIDNIRELLNDKFDFAQYPELHKVLLSVARMDVSRFMQAADDEEKLNIRITSFSFRRGLPVDPSGNGGGFIFDCRFVLNPGRQAQYRSLSGLDLPVQEFLMAETEMPEFLDRIEEMVMPSVNKYKHRNFKNLMICFGCTGGQHRSVFAAEQIAERLRKLAGVNIIVHHRETRNWPQLA